MRYAEIAADEQILCVICCLYLRAACGISATYPQPCLKSPVCCCLPLRRVLKPKKGQKPVVGLI